MKSKKFLRSRDAMQKILNEWLALELGPCMGLNDLILRPHAVYEKALITQKYKAKPDPSSLYSACKKALQLPYCAMYGIFIVNDDLVEIDAESLLELFINTK